MQPSHLRVTVKNAADKIYYPQCIDYLEKNLPEEFIDLAKATLPYYLPSRILDLPSKDERRKAIDSIPADTYPKHTKQLVMSGVQAMWKKRGI